MGFRIGLLFIILISFHSVAFAQEVNPQEAEKAAEQATPAESAEEFKTNSGEEFKDPFAEPVPDNANSVAPSSPATTPTAPATAPTQAPSASPSPAPAVMEPSPINPAPEAPKVPGADDLKFPTPIEPTGPRTQDIDPVRKLEEAAVKHKWYLAAEFGAGLNINRRPNQLHLEVEGAYRFSERWSLALIANYRIFKDRILGFFLMPGYFWKLTDSYSTYRVDFQVGLGTGWVFRGFKGSTYQVGYFPVRTSTAFVFYPSASWAMTAGVDNELYLYRVDSDGTSINEMSHKKGPLAQFVPTIGVRYNF